jgi:DNA-binding CsgD family transcriptional regulator
MASLLAGVLSEAAALFYEELIATGGVSLRDRPEVAASDIARELIDKGFARERYVGGASLVPVEPARAIDNAILVRQRQILEQYQTLLKLRDEMRSLQRTYLSSAFAGAEPHELVRLLTDPREIGSLSVELCLSAEQEVLSLETARFSRPPDPRSVRHLPAEVIERGVRFRNIYARALLEIEGAADILRASVEAGWQSRVYPELPMKAVIVDERSALLPLGPTGMEGAILVHAPPIISALREYFEMLWARSVPLSGVSAKLTTEQQQVLGLVLTGMTDAAIARHLGVSERTVRRHVGALLKLLGVDNRVSLAVTAIREGWVG